MSTEFSELSGEEGFLPITRRENMEISSLQGLTTDHRFKAASRKQKR